MFAARFFPLLTAAGSLAACGILGGDGQSPYVHPEKAESCRQAVWVAMAGEGYQRSWARSVVMRSLRDSDSGDSVVLAGFEAWVFPRQQTHLLVIFMTADCEVTDLQKRDPEYLEET